VDHLNDAGVRTPDDCEVSMRTIKKEMRLTWGGACLATALVLAGCGGSDADVQPTPTPAVSLTDLVLLMHFEEGGWSGASGEVVDSSGLGNNGTAVGGARIRAEGKFGRAGWFDASTGVRVEDTAYLHPTNQLTVSAWVRPSSSGAGAWRGIVAKRVNYTEKAAYTLYLDQDGKPAVDIDTEDNRAAVTTPLATEVWSHVALVYDGRLPQSSRVTVYVNGQVAGTLVESSSSIRAFDSPLWIGCLPLGQAAQGFQGLVDEVAIWHRALSLDEIHSLATATAPLSK
jgi:MSHA biogenesis protein MshQ